MKQARYYRRRMLLMVWNTAFNALTLLTNGVIVAGVMRHWHDVPRAVPEAVNVTEGTLQP